MDSAASTMATDMIYLNLNQDNRVTQTEENVALTDDRTSAILADPGQWNVSLVNFSIKASTIPLMYWDADTHTITLRHTASGDVYTQPIRYADTRQTGSSSGWVWSVNEIVDQTNAALATAFGALSGAHPTTATSAPVVSVENGLCVIRAQTDLLADAGILANDLTNALYLSMTPYQRLFPLDPSLSAADAAVQYAWPIPNNAWTLVETGPGGGPAVEWAESRQVRPTVATWFRAKQLYFRVGGLSVSGELMPSGDTGSSSASASLLTNFHATGTAQLEGDGLTYFVSGSHRWYTLRHSGPLQSLAITVFWEDSGGSPQHPVTLAHGESAVARLLFRKKTLGLG